MGFLQSIIGGSSGKSTSTQGYGALTPNGQTQLDDIAHGARMFIDPYNQRTGKVNQAAIDMFTPKGQSAVETKAIDAMTKGFAPTSESLKAAIDMQMNPYDSFVTDEINRQAQGSNSILQENMSNAGAMGSNRQMFGASDLERDRLSTIGQFKQSEYNTALSNALTTIPGLQQQDASNQMGVGAFERGLDTATRQAPLAALQASAGLAQQTGLSAAQGSTGTSESRSSSTPGLMAAISGFAGGPSSAFSNIMSSDRRLKDNIILIGVENGHNIYEFSYKDEPDEKYIGVMADEVLEKVPEAVVMSGDFMAVDYDKIGVKFRRAA